MKEPRVIKPKLGWRNSTKKLEELLNSYKKTGLVINNHYALTAYHCSYFF
jgi:hypothetical protein